MTTKTIASFVLFLSTIVWAPNIYAVDGYLMYCRTGHDFKVELRPVGNRKTQIYVHFKKSNVKYDVANPQLQPGTCAWKDRPLNSQEPSRMGHKTNFYFWTTFNTSGQGKPKLIAQNVDASRQQRTDINRFLNAISNDDYITFKVKLERYKTGSWFEITSFE